jgi:hypothetical protein
MRRGISWLGVASLLTGFVTAAALPAQAATSISTKYLLNHLAVAAEHSAGYSRTKFTLWIDADHDGCNTRKEVLIAEAIRKPHVGARCALSGGKWYSQYDGVTTTSWWTFDIDHLVPLAEAWQSGAWRWNADTRKRYANDLGYAPDLIAVSAHSNRSKGDREPMSWLPPRKSFDCRYVAWWVAVKWRWHLSVDRTEKSFLTTRLASCRWPSVGQPSRPRIGVASTSGGSSSTSGAVITAIYFDSPGADDGSNASLNAEWVRIKNTTNTAKTLTAWTLRDASSHIYTFPRFTLAAGASVQIHTGSGANGANNLYWGSGSYIWNNSGDTAYLKNASGTTVDACSYTSAAAPQASC